MNNNTIKAIIVLMFVAIVLYVVFNIITIALNVIVHYILPVAVVLLLIYIAYMFVRKKRFM